MKSHDLKRWQYNAVVNLFVHLLTNGRSKCERKNVNCKIEHSKLYTSEIDGCKNFIPVRFSSESFSQRLWFLSKILYALDLLYFEQLKWRNCPVVLFPFLYTSCSSSSVRHRCRRRLVVSWFRHAYVGGTTNEKDGQSDNRPMRVDVLAYKIIVM